MSWCCRDALDVRRLGPRRAGQRGRCATSMESSAGGTSSEASWILKALEEGDEDLGIQAMFGREAMDPRSRRRRSAACGSHRVIIVGLVFNVAAGRAGSASCAAAAEAWRRRQRLPDWAHGTRSSTPTTCRRRNRNLARATPLAARMRPRTIDEFVGQEHFFGEGKLLRRIVADRLSSLIFYGPPGTGKTALAQVIAQHTQAFQRPQRRRAEVRAMIERARARRAPRADDPVPRRDPPVQQGPAGRAAAGRRGGGRHPDRGDDREPVLRDQLPLVSRSQIFTSSRSAASTSRRILGGRWPTRSAGWADPVPVTDDALEFLAEMCDGDARTAFAALERGVEVGPRGASSPSTWRSRGLDPAEGAQLRPTGRHALRPRVSAFIKTLRGSDPDAAIYWLARMLEAGEDPRFVARRIVILASEDVGNADPQALRDRDRGLAGGRDGRHAGGPLNLCPGGDLPGDGPEVELGDAGDRGGPRGRAERAKIPRTTCGTGTTRGEAARPRPGLPVRPRRARRGGRPDAASARGRGRAYYEPTDRGYEGERPRRPGEE